jgi:exonuclease VII large subunit
VSDRPLRQHLARQRDAVRRHGAQARRCLARLLLDKRQALETCSKLMASLSYHSVLQRGFALVRDEFDKPCPPPRRRTPARRSPSSSMTTTSAR